MCKKELRSQDKLDELLLVLKKKDIEQYFEELRQMDKLGEIVQYLPYFRNKYDHSGNLSPVSPVRPNKSVVASSIPPEA